MKYYLTSSNTSCFMTFTGDIYQSSSGILIMQNASILCS